MLESALTCFRTQPTSVSLTDCLVMAYADHYEATEIFGFDVVFVRNGYHLPGMIPSAGGRASWNTEAPTVPLLVTSRTPRTQLGNRCLPRGMLLRTLGSSRIGRVENDVAAVAVGAS